MEDIKWMTDATILEHVGSRVREWRLEVGLSQKDLAAKALLSLQTVQKLEKGKGASLFNLIRILRIVGRLEALEAFTAEREISPIALEKLNSHNKVRQRAPKRKKDENAEGTPLW